MVNFLHPGRKTSHDSQENHPTQIHRPGAVATVAVPGILRRKNSPNRLNIAVIGCGGARRR